MSVSLFDVNNALYSFTIALRSSTPFRISTILTPCANGSTPGHNRTGLSGRNHRSLAVLLLSYHTMQNEGSSQKAALRLGSVIRGRTG